MSADDGLTSQYLYDKDLTDGVGLDATAGVTVDKLGGGTYSVSLSQLLDKLDDPTASGGAGITFGANATGAAVVSISPEEELTAVIVDGIGRTVCVGILEPHNGSSPNAPITWSCTLHDGTASVSGFGSTHEVQSINALGDVTKTRTDGLGRVLEVVDAGNNSTTYEYDAAANVTKIRDPNGNGVDLVHDSLGRVTSSTDTQGDTVTYAYWADGSLKTTTDAKSETVTHVYDAAGQVIAEYTSGTAATSPLRTFIYGDTIDEPIALVDGNLPLNVIGARWPQAIVHPSLGQRPRNRLKANPLGQRPSSPCVSPCLDQ